MFTRQQLGINTYIFAIIIKYVPYRHTYQNVLQYFLYW